MKPPPLPPPKELRQAAQQAIQSGVRGGLSSRPAVRTLRDDAAVGVPPAGRDPAAAAAAASEDEHAHEHAHDHEPLSAPQAEKVRNRQKLHRVLDSAKVGPDELERTLESMRADLDPSFFEHLRWEVEQQASLHTSLTPHASRCATHFGDTHFCDTHFCDTHFCDTHFCDSPLFVTAQFCDTHFCGTHFCDSPLL